MAVFRIQVHYQQGLLAKWSNVWHIDAVDLVNAASIFNSAAVGGLLNLLHPTCTLLRLLCSDPASDDFTVTTVNQDGISDASGDLLPLYNSCKVLFDQGLGRPDLKYFKGFVTEGVQAGGNFITGVQASVNSTIQDIIAAVQAEEANLCSEGGVEYNTSTVQLAVQMRQMHRKRRRVVVPTP